jgi:hypothetical protein
LVRLSRKPLLALCVLASAAFPGFSPAQDQVVPAIQTTVAAPSLSIPQYDELVAPVALYPDALLADVLAASTYPLEIVEEDRWLGESDNASLAGDNLAAALGAQPWDPGVKSLAPFPDVVAMLDSHLDWTEELGQAFLANPDAVLAAVQRMRARAIAAGSLSSNGEETVADTDNEIAISTPPSDYLYVPEYDPWCAFGNWPYSVPRPYFFEPWPGYCEPDEYSVVFSPGVALPFDYWSWGYFDWRHKKLLVRRGSYDRFHPASEPAGNVWRHDARQEMTAAMRTLQGAHKIAPPAQRPRVGTGFARAPRAATEFPRFMPQRMVRAEPQRPVFVPRPAPHNFARGFVGARSRAPRPVPER